MKHLIACADGTWKAASSKDATNVYRFQQALAPTDMHGNRQLSFYDGGVGAGGLLQKIGGLMGQGLWRNVYQIYGFAMDNYEPGDKLYLYGFSRGAYTVRSVAGLIRKCGLLKTMCAKRLEEAYKIYRKRDETPDTDEAKAFRSKYSHETNISVIGVWDTVGNLGIPGVRRLTSAIAGVGGLFSSWDHRFHDEGLSRIVQRAYHAVAIDEMRSAFKPTLWREPPHPGQDVRQVWFVGAHSDVGGGYPSTGLSDISLLWMVDLSQNGGLVFDPARLSTSPDAVAHDELDRWYWAQRATREIGSAVNEAVHLSAGIRGELRKYEAGNLRTYLEGPMPQLDTTASNWLVAAIPAAVQSFLRRYFPIASGDTTAAPA